MAMDRQNNKFKGGFNDRGGPGRSSAPMGAPAKLPNNYLANGYMNTSGEYDVHYVTSMAEEIGKQLAVRGGQGATATSKVRAYFDIVEATHHQLVNKGISVNNAIISLATLKSRVNNATAKGNASKLFKDFIDKNVDLVINSPKDKVLDNLTGFKQHFEAVVCYMH